MKKTVCLFLCLLLLLSALPAAAIDVAGHQVQLSGQNLSVNGSVHDCEKYNIDGSNFFKLRDLAYLLNGTASQFDVGYDAASNTVTVTTGAPYASPNGLELAAGADHSASAEISKQSLIINGAHRSDLEVWNIGGSNFFKLRDLGAALGFAVDYHDASRTMLVTSTDYVPPAGNPVTHSQVGLAGRGNVDVITVDVNDPRVTVKTAMVNNTLGATASFRDIVEGAGNPIAVVNGNFFESYKPFQTPIGHVMADGMFLHAHSGLHSLGIDRSGHAHIGKLPVFVNLKLDDGRSWAAFSVNTVEGQGSDASELYTPAWGQSVDFSIDAYAMTVRNGLIASYRGVAAGETVEIPGDGYVLFIGPGFAGTAWFLDPGSCIGQRVTLDPYLFNPTDDAFDISEMVSIVSGSPRLLKDGAVWGEQEEGFNDPNRFGPKAANPRTAVGVDAVGKLVIASFPSATIQEMADFMLSQGCVDAFNLDGGASRAMYYNGNYLAQPGRNLTTTLQVFVNG